jgi:DnaK suppressor protein
MNGLDHHQWQALQARLEQARAALLRQLADDRDHQTDPRLPVRHETEASPADNASQRTLNALVQGTAAHTARQLHLVRHALAKFTGRRYGLCENCEGEIGYSRLEARPEARRCINCQTRLEQKRC